MHVIKGDFLRGRSDPVGVVVAPTNGVIAPAGLVMGAGAALALARHQPQLRQALARRIERDGVREGRFLVDRTAQGHHPYGFPRHWVGGVGSQCSPGSASRTTPCSSFPHTVRL